MLKWIIIIQILALCVLLTILSLRAFYQAGSPARLGERAKINIPVKWTDEPVGTLSDPAIIIQKSARLLTILDGTEAVKTYHVVVGTNQDDKIREGDQCTPEGVFYICTRQGPGQTKFYRSLGLSYPNTTDAKRGLLNKMISQREYDSIARAIQTKSKPPPWKTALGGEIMIHGDRNGRSGTLGCVAMDNSDILELFNVLSIGTPVKILP